MSGWYRFHVYCNRSLIASFQTQELASNFADSRSSRYPKNEYTVKDSQQ